nr:hypothetical protein B0A51_14729 [Rachicladosporium sp. CCFEE 5018]
MRPRLCASSVLGYFSRRCQIRVGSFILHLTANTAAVQESSSKAPPAPRPASATVPNLFGGLAAEGAVAADEVPDVVAVDVESEVDVAYSIPGVLLAVVFASFSCKAAPAVETLVVLLQQS